MQKNYSQIERYVRGIHRNIKGNLVAGAIIIFVMIIVHLVSGCEPMLPAESENNKKTEILSHNQDSTNNQGVSRKLFSGYVYGKDRRVRTGNKQSHPASSQCIYSVGIIFVRY